ncbi:MAG: prepilin-type N-terminal cleavage/methylation domain-containing protein [Candidatus Omnitrophota bacterium]
MIIKKGFTLLEIMVALTVFTLVISAAGSIFVSVDRAYKKQVDSVELIQNLRWALEYMANEIRYSAVSSNPGWASLGVIANGRTLRFGIDTNSDNDPDTWVEYSRESNTLSRRWRDHPAGGGWGPYQEIANYIVDNPDLLDNSNGFGLPDGRADPIFMQSGNDDLLTIELTAQKDNLVYTKRVRVKPRN